MIELPEAYTKLLDLENDGLNIVADGHHLYIRCKRAMYKYSLSDMNLMAQNVVFKKDGKARNFSVCERYVYLTDFCDLHVLDKETLKPVDVIRLGTDVSSDLGAVRFNDKNAYICIRNGKMAVMDLGTHAYEKYDICTSSYWDFCIVGNHIYIGTVQGKLLEVDSAVMKVKRQATLGKKNIYSVVLHENIIYTVSQDMTIKAVNADTFEIICTAKKAVRGMARLLGVYDSNLVVADSNKVTLWDINMLDFSYAFDFPTGQFNKGVVLHGNMLYGSDYQSVYSMELDKYVGRKTIND